MSEGTVIWMVAFLSVTPYSLATNLQNYNSSVGQIRQSPRFYKPYVSPSYATVVKNEPYNISVLRAPEKVGVYQVDYKSPNKTVEEVTVLHPVSKNVTEPPVTEPNFVEPPTTHKSVLDYEEQSCPGERYDEKLSLQLSNFVLDLAQRILKTSSGSGDSGKDTEVISPTCIMGALLLPMLGSNGRTFEEFYHFFMPKITSLLGNTSFELHKEFSLLLFDATLKKQDSNLVRQSDPWRYTPHKYMNRPVKAINDTTDYKLSIANGIFVHEDFPLRDDYTAAVRKGYKTKIKAFDFRHKAEDARNCINNLIKSKTRGKIEQILTGPISAQTNMIIVSSIYFNAKWERPFFDKGATRLHNFYPNGVQNDPIQIMMMSTGGLFPYYNDTEGECQIIGLPYKGNLTTMYVIIPYNSNRARLQEFHKSLTADKIDRLISKMELKTTTMVFPKMDIQNTLRLRNVFTQLGLDTLFNPMESDLSLITDKEADTYPYTDPQDCEDDDDEDDAEGMESVGMTENPEGGIKPTTFPSVGITQQGPQPVDTTPAPVPVTTQPVPATELSDITTTISPEASETYKPPEVEPSSLTPTTTTESTPCPSSGVKGTSKCGFNSTLRNHTEARNNIEAWRHRSLNTPKTDYYPDTSSNFRRRRHTCREDTDIASFDNLERLRNKEDLHNPHIYVDEIVHKIDLTVNEQGTVGGAATAATLHRNAPEVPLRVEVPFIFLIRHDPTRLPIFYGLVYKPTTNLIQV